MLYVCLDKNEEKIKKLSLFRASIMCIYVSMFIYIFCFKQYIDNVNFNSNSEILTMEF